MKAKGFNLIELTIVVAMITILAAIAIPNFFRFQCRVRAIEAGIAKDVAQEMCYSPSEGMEELDRMEEAGE